MDASLPVTYGEFPSLFFGFPSDGPVDLDDRETLWRLKLVGGQKAVRRIIGTERMTMLRAPALKREEESRRLLTRLQELGLADLDMGGSEAEK